MRRESRRAPAARASLPCRRIAVQSPTTAAGVAITSFGYDLRGLLTTLTFADNSAEVYDHDRVGRRTLITRPSGKQISIVYDNMGRQTGLIPPDNAPPETQAWDSRSRRTLLIDGTGSTGFGYYSDGRLKTAATPKGKIDYGYDPGGR